MFSQLWQTIDKGCKSTTKIKIKIKIRGQRWMSSHILFATKIEKDKQTSTMIVHKKGK